LCLRKKESFFSKIMMRQKRPPADLTQHITDSPETMLLLMIFPPRVARDLGTTVMMLPLVVLT